VSHERDHGATVEVLHCSACDAPLVLAAGDAIKCPSCGAETPGYIVASGRGEIFSYVVHHHPAVPGKQLPIVIALVELEEGVRMLGELVDASPEDVEIGKPVELALTKIDDDLTLPYWRLA
jgi:uncharacterized OB-fold protein